MSDIDNPAVADGDNPTVARNQPVAGTAARRAARAAASGSRPADSVRSTPPSRSSRDARPSDPAPPPAPGRKALDPDALAALEEERDFLLRSLEDLEREHAAGDVDQHDYEALKDDYTVRAAAVLRALKGRQTAMAANRRPRSRGRTLAVAAAVAVFAVLLGVGVTQATGRRNPGDTITGDVRQLPRDKVIQAQARMGQEPFADTIKAFDEVIAEDPANAEAYQWKGWLLNITARSATGDDLVLLKGKALEALSKAVELDPDLGTAHLFRASLYSDLGESAAGLADLALVKDADVPPDLRPLAESLRQRLQQSATPGTGTTIAPDG